jgi:GNAT superfamily N-acetyltransferase
LIRTATRTDLPRIVEILRRGNDTAYDIEAVAEEKCFGHGFTGEPRVRLFGDEGVAVTCGKYLRLIAVDRDRRGRGVGTALLRDAAAEVIGAEPGNYFTPGVLHDQAGFFLRRGYKETASTWNLHMSFPAERGIWAGGEKPASPTPEMLDFVRQHFGRIWEFEAARAETAFYLEDTAFAVVEANNRGLGTFGPTGVAKAKRGLGHGRTLLRAALTHLAAKGYDRAIIPWTDAVEFYRRSCGAEPAHRFVTLSAC